MNIYENFRSAIFNILSSKMRTILTTLGIIIGITSVIVITSIGKGFENQINSEFDNINSENISIQTSSGETIREKDRLNLKDVENIKKIPNVKYSSPDYSTKISVKLKNNKETKNANFYGVNEDSKDVDKIEMLFGRYVSNSDRISKAKVCLIDNKLAKDIFGREDAIGEEISIKNTFGASKEMKLQIIGIYKLKDDGFSNSANVYSPVETVMEFAGNNSQNISGINLNLKEKELFQNTKKEIIKVLSIAHKNSPKKYSVFGNFQLADSMSGTIKIFTIFVGFVAGISLLVGGIGVMNIMLVTVTERTREIGIRKSLGATNSNIKMQFLIEAMSISMLGGIIGIILGYVGTFIAWQVLKLIGNTIVPSVSYPVIIGAFIISTLIGIIFGVYPAGKAAKLDPIEALRYE